jgi:hypothetical protein
LRRQQKIREIVDIEGEIKSKKEELDKIQTQRTNLTTSINNNNNMCGGTISNRNENSDLIIFVLQQAVSI